MKKAILYLEGGHRVPVELTDYPPERKMRHGVSSNSASLTCSDVRNRKWYTR